MILRRILVGEVSAGMMRAMQACEVVALDKGGGVPRPIRLSCILRRSLLKGLMKAIKNEVGEEVGPLQFGVGTSGGAEVVVLAVPLAAARAGMGAIALYTSAAFQHISRHRAIVAAKKYLPHHHCHAIEVRDDHCLIRRRWMVSRVASAEASGAIGSPWSKPTSALRFSLRASQWE